MLLSGTQVEYDADVNAFRGVLRDVLRRFPVTLCILVGDRGMMSKDIMKEIKASDLEYILGLRMRKDTDGDRVLGSPGQYRGVESNLRIKEVCFDGKRFVLCHNPQESKRQGLIQQAVIESPRKQIGRGIKSLVKNRQYKRYLRIEGENRLEVNEKAIEEESRYDGKWVLKTNTSLPAFEVALAYKRLWQVERAFREMKSSLRLRPMYHWTEQRVRGHIMVCFLALVLESALMRSLKASGNEDVNMKDLMADLKRLQALRISVFTRSRCNFTGLFQRFLTKALHKWRGI